jgi:hypothetical protein
MAKNATKRFLFSPGEAERKPSRRSIHLETGVFKWFSLEEAIAWYV